MDIRVAGVSYHQEAVSFVRQGDDVLLEPEPLNAVDQNAIRVLVRNQHVGYIPAYATAPIHNWLQTKRITSVQVNGVGRPEGSKYIGVGISIDVAPIPERVEV